MPTVTGSALLQRVRDYADQSAEGDGARAFVTDSMIYSWLSLGYRTALRAVARGGYPLSATTLSVAAPGASFSFGAAQALAVLNVSVLRGTTLVRLPRLPFGQEVNLTGTSAVYWQPAITVAGAFTISLYPAESSGTVQVKYVPDPVTLAADSSVYLPGSWEEVVVLGAALRCLARTNEDNSMIKALYGEAILEAEQDTLSAFGEQVIRNTDDVYPPGYDQGRAVDGLYDYSPYVLP